MKQQIVLILLVSIVAAVIIAFGGPPLVQLYTDVYADNTKCEDGHDCVIAYNPAGHRMCINTNAKLNGQWTVTDEKCGEKKQEEPKPTKTAFQPPKNTAVPEATKQPDPTEVPKSEPTKPSDIPADDPTILISNPTATCTPMPVQQNVSVDPECDWCWLFERFVIAHERQSSAQERQASAQETMAASEIK